MGGEHQDFPSKQVADRAASRRQTQNPAKIVANSRLKPREKPRVIHRESTVKNEAAVGKVGTPHANSPQPRTHNRRVSHLRCPPFSCQYRCLMVIDRFSLALEPWTGIGFGLAALLPPNNKKVPPEGDTNSLYVKLSIQAAQSLLALSKIMWSSFSAAALSMAGVQ